MPLRAVLAVSILVPLLGGCGSMRKAGGPPLSLVNLRPGRAADTQPTRDTSRTAKPESSSSRRTSKKTPQPTVPDAAENPPAADADSTTWMASMRRRLAKIARDVEADLDFHEREGLDSFSPDAAEQVRQMRAEMGGSASGGR
jgi:hypothetical protein